MLLNPTYTNGLCPLYSTNGLCPLYSTKHDSYINRRMKLNNVRKVRRKEEYKIFVTSSSYLRREQ